MIGRNPLPQPSYYDRLFRNLRGERFADVSLLANVFEPGFSHGVGVEDFDQDGFPDLYVCNLGANRLFHNNGDGSFVDVTQEAGIAGNEWSIGSVIADFSGDGLPDVYVGNYSKIEETEKRMLSFNRRTDGMHPERSLGRIRSTLSQFGQRRIRGNHRCLWNPRNIWPPLE